MQWDPKLSSSRSDLFSNNFSGNCTSFTASFHSTHFTSASNSFFLRDESFSHKSGNNKVCFLGICLFTLLVQVCFFLLQIIFLHFSYYICLLTDYSNLSFSSLCDKVDHFYHHPCQIQRFLSILFLRFFLSLSNLFCWSRQFQDQQRISNCLCRYIKKTTSLLLNYILT